MSIMILLHNTAAGITSGQLPTPKANSHAIQALFKIIFGIIGALALLMVMVSGLRYITSSGDPQKASQAKQGIIYSLVGVAVALAAVAIVSFVAGRL